MNRLFVKILILLVINSCSNSQNNTNLNEIFFTVIYEANGSDNGTVPVDENKYYPGSNVKVKPYESLSKDNYDFYAWNTKNDASGTYYNVNAYIENISNNIVLYAIWHEKQVQEPILITDPRIRIEITLKNQNMPNLEIAKLLYNKTNVLTIEIDDALNDIYKSLYPLFVGGMPIHDTTESLGLFITDSCNNDVSYKANTTTWVLSSNTLNDWFNWSDGTHWLNYFQLDAIVSSGFGVVSHGYYSNMSHANANIEIAADSFVSWAENRYTVRPLYAVKPGGVVFDETTWKNKWFENGLRFIVLGSGSASYITRIDNLNINTFTEPLQVGRVNVETLTATSMMNYVSNMILEEGNNWLRFFGHHIRPDSYIIYQELKNFFLDFNLLYGKDGFDSIWVANINELISYLYCRDAIYFDYDFINNKHIYFLNQEQIPSYINKRLVSIIVSNKEDISTIEVFNANEHTKLEDLINIRWNK